MSATSAEGAKRIQAAAKLVFSDPDQVDPLGRDSDQGFFLGPLLFVQGMAGVVDVVHSHEVLAPARPSCRTSRRRQNATRLVAAGGGPEARQQRLLRRSAFAAAVVQLQRPSITA
ncbi:MAG: hypothetical protein IPQ09_26500 [Myxococcales bacterium]|nr:hypothetical protein [Myxococcales bacterium]